MTPLDGHRIERLHHSATQPEDVGRELVEAGGLALRVDRPQ